MKQELRLGPPTMSVEYPHNLDGRKPYRPNFVELLQTAQYKQTVRFWVLLGAIAVDIALQYWF